MKFIVLIAGILSLASATPTRTRKFLDSSDPEHDADVKNENYWAEYHSNMIGILAKRKSGTCTLQNVEYRENWYVKLPTNLLCKPG